MASMQAISERVKSITDTLTKPQVLPFTVVGGAVVATAAGFGLWRLLTGAHEGPLSEDQAILKSERKITLPSKKTIVVRRVLPSYASTQAIGTLIAAHMKLNSDPVLEAVTPEVRVLHGNALAEKLFVRILACARCVRACSLTTCNNSHLCGLMQSICMLAIA